MAPHTDHAHADPSAPTMTAHIKVYRPEEQRRLIEQMYPSAVMRLQSKLGRQHGRLWKLALHRGLTLGVEQYGDASFLLGRDELDHEVDCELADGLFYESIYALMDRGMIPWGGPAGA